MAGKTKEKMSVIQFLRLEKMKVALISLMHGANDMYAGFLATLLPFIRENLGISYALAGNFNAIVGVFHIICQPTIGYLSDRIRRPFPIMIGPILCGLGIVMLPNVNSYAAALFFAALWGFGSALFHPQGAGGIGYVSSPERFRDSMMWYNLAGMAGAAASPFAAVAVIKALGYPWLPVVLIPALILAPAIYASMPLLRSEIVRDEKQTGFFKTLWSIFALLYPFWGISTLRDTLLQGIRFFLPMKIQSEGGDLQHVGVVVFCITLGCTLSMLPMGKIAARYGGKRSLLWSQLLGGGILLAAVSSTGLLSISLYVLGLTCVYSTLSLTTAMAQSLAPNNRSVASTIVMGLAWGISNMMISPLGKIADIFGLDVTLALLAFLPIMATPLLMTPPFKMLKE